MHVLPVSTCRLGTSLRDHLHKGWILDIHHSDCHMLPLDVLDVSEQCVSFHVGGRVAHVSDVPGMFKNLFLNMVTVKLAKLVFPFPLAC